MKRPEGFDRVPAPPREAPSTRAAASARPARPDPAPVPPRPPAASPRRDREPEGEQTPERERTPDRRRRPLAVPTALLEFRERREESRAVREAEEESRAAESAARRAERRRRRAERAEMRRFTRRSRARRIAWLSGFGVLAVLLGLIAVAVFSPLLALREIQVDGTSRLDAAQVREAIDGQLGTPLALLDEGRITEELSGFRLIRSYVTEIVPPDTLLVHIVERSPIGAVKTGERLALVDAAGVTIDTVDERPEGLPRLLVEGGVGSPAFTAAAEVLNALPEETLAQVTQVTATTRDDVTLGLDGGGKTVVWGGAEDSEYKALVLARLLAANGHAWGEYDVSAPGTAVFRGN